MLNRKLAIALIAINCYQIIFNGYRLPHPLWFSFVGRARRDGQRFKTRLKFLQLVIAVGVIIVAVVIIVVVAVVIVVVVVVVVVIEREREMATM